MMDYHTVFIDTSLNTHLITVISNLDTISDLKRKIEEEHPLCFPATGKIAIQAVKVKRSKHHYYIPDSFIVKFAFHGVTENWFLSLDVSTLEEHDGNQCPQNLLTFGCIPNNNSVDRVEHSLNGYTRQGIHSGKRTEVSEELAIIKTEMSKHGSVFQCNVLEGENIMEKSASNVEASKMVITPELSLLHNEKNENLPLDGLLIKQVNDVHRSENWRKENKPGKKHNREVATLLTSEKAVREGEATMRVLNNNSIKPSIESDLRQHNQRQRLSEPHRSNTEAKHCDSIPEVGRPNTEPSAIDADITKSDASNVHGSSTENAKNQYVFGVEANSCLNAKEPNNLQMVTELSCLENISTVQIQYVEEERALPWKNYSEEMQSKKFKSPTKVEKEVNNLMVTFDLLDQDGTVEPKNSSKRRKKTKNSIRRTLFSSDRDNAKCSEFENPSVTPQETLCREHPSNKTETEQSQFLETNSELMKVNTEHTIVRKDAIVGNDLVFLQHISITEANTENREERVRKKSKKKQMPSAQFCTDFKVENKNLHQNSIVEANCKGDVVSASSLSQSKILEEPNLESKNFGFRTSVPAGQDLELGKPGTVQSETLGNTYERIPVGVNLNNIAHSSSSQYVSNNSTGSSTKASKINSQKLIPNLCQHEDDASVELMADKNYKNKADDGLDFSEQIKLTQTNAENTEEIVRRKSKQKSLVENCTEAEDQNVHHNKILETNNNRAVILSSQFKSKTWEKPASIDHLNGIEIESEKLSVESDPVPGHSNKRTDSQGNFNRNASIPIVGFEGKAHNLSESSGESSSINFKKYFLKEHQHEVDAPGEVLIDKSNRNRADNHPKEIKKKNLLVSLKSSDKQGIVGKLQLGGSSTISPQGSFVRGNSADFEIMCEKLPKASKQETKPLLSGMFGKLDSNPEEAIPTSICSGYVSESSEDGPKTPLDYSAFSQSDGESNSICTSPVDGSYTRERERNGRRSRKSSFSSRAKYLALDTIFRSSIRYKKARLTASQSWQEDDSKKLVL